MQTILYSQGLWKSVFCKPQNISSKGLNVAKSLIVKTGGYFL